MPFKNRSKNIEIIVALWATLLYQNMHPVFAQSFSSTEYDRLPNYEKIVFGEAKTGTSAEKRLQLIEKQIFGKVQNGTPEQRLDAIGKLVDSHSTSTYFPPIPPQLDRSEFAKTPVQPPENVKASSSTDSAPPVAETEDRVHEMLRQAMALYSQGKNHDAQRIYQQVLGLDFQNTDANFNLGSMAEDRGDFQAASKYYATAAATSPNDQEIRDALKSVQIKLKNQSIATAPKPSNSIPTSEESSAALKQIAGDAANLYKNGKYDEAIAKLNYLAKLTPYDANTQFALGQAWRAKGNNNEALKHLRSATTLNPKNDLYLSTLNQVQKSASTDGPLKASNDQDPAGQITPFQGLPAADTRSAASAYDPLGLAQIQNLLNSAMPGVIVESYGINSGGTGLPGASYGNYGAGYGYPMMPANGGTRLTRVVRSSLAGAAYGALSNRGYAGGMSEGAKRGALYGGLMELMTGGYGGFVGY